MRSPVWELGGRSRAGPLFRGCLDASPPANVCELTLVRTGIVTVEKEQEETMKVRLGIDVACRAEHQASLAGADGEFVWSGWRFTSTPAALEALWAKIPPDSEVQVVMEPTRNAWAPLAAWLGGQGAEVVLVAPEQSSDLRNYYNKHAKTDKLDSRVLARLPLLHPEGLTPHSGPTPADPLRRAVRRRTKLVKARTAAFQRLDALVELLGPSWADVLGTGNYSKTALVVLERYGDPGALKRAGLRRLTDLMIKTSKGAWRGDKAAELLVAVDESLALWAKGGLDFAELGLDIAGEVRVVRSIQAEITDLETRIAVLFAAADRHVESKATEAEVTSNDEPSAKSVSAEPGSAGTRSDENATKVESRGIVASIPTLGRTLGAGILGRFGDFDRFDSLAGVRSFTGLVPKVDQSGTSGGHGGPTKSGDPGLREALFLAADQLRRVDPTIAARYHRLVVDQGKHHDSALCSLGAVLATRIAACWRRREHYVLRDTDGRVITEEEGRAIVAERFKISDEVRQARRRVTRAKTLKNGTGGRKKESTKAAPAPGPSSTEPIEKAA
jgi:transposase